MRFETAVPLGRGAMGEVLKAWDPDLERYVALKLLRRDDPVSVERILREARAQARIEHPNVCKVYGVGETEDGRPYISMQLVEGEPLDRAVEGLGLDERVRLLADVVDAVQAAHSAGFIHRDLKPSNILVERDPETGLRPFVLDFGIAREHSVPGFTMTGEVVGTPGYMSPEQARGEVRTLDRRSDIFALGVILYELLGDRSPWEGASGAEVLVAVLQNDPATLRRVAPNTPRDLETIVATCLEKDPDRRYQSARALHDDLIRYLEGLPIAARRTRLGVRLWLWVSRHKLAAALILVMLIGAPAGVGKYTLDLHSERGRALAARTETEELMDFMLEDLYKRLLPLGRTDLLREVAQRALVHNERYSASDTTIEGRHRRAQAFQNLGLVLESQGDLAAALRSFERSRDLAAAVVAAEPDDPRWRRSRTALESAIAGALLEQGDNEAAAVACDTALESARAVVKRFGPEEPNLAELWNALTNMGWLRQQSGDPEAALTAFGDALDVASARVAADDAAAEWRYRLSVAHGNVGLVEEELDRTKAASESHEAALAQAVELTRREPDNARWQFEVQLDRSRLGHVRETAGRFADAEREYRSALQLGHRLNARDPGNAKWERELGVALSDLGEFLRRDGRSVEAVPLLEESLAISRRLAARDPSNESLKNDLAWDLVQMGSLRAEIGDEEAAVAAWEEGLGVIAPLAEETDISWFRDTQVTALLFLGRVEEARPLVENLVAAGWNEPDFLELARRYGLIEKNRPVESG